MNWMAVIVGLLVFILMAAIAGLAHIFDLVDEVRANNEAIEDIIIFLNEKGV